MGIRNFRDPRVDAIAAISPQGYHRFGGHDEVHTDFCYRSKRSPTLHFGLGAETAVDALVETRSGTQQPFRNLKADQLHTLTIAKL